VQALINPTPGNPFFLPCNATRLLPNLLQAKLRATTHQEQQPIIKLKDKCYAKNKNFKQALQYTLDSLGLRAYIAVLISLGQGPINAAFFVRINSCP